MLKRADADGIERLYVVGRSSRGASDATVELRGRALVHPDEVFTATEAGEIFVHYFHTLTVPDRYRLRPFGTP